jgi:chromosomal replication initiator protein
MAIVYAPHADVFEPASRADLAAHYRAVLARRPKPKAPKVFIAVNPTPLPLTPEQGRELMLEAHAELARAAMPKMCDVMKAVSKLTGISVADIRSPRRIRRITDARMIFYIAAKRLTSCSLPQIGRFVGYRDHSSVLHGVRKMDANPHARDAAMAKVVDILEGRT